MSKYGHVGRYTLRCEITRNPCGTDTVAKNSEPDCGPCAAAHLIAELEAKTFDIAQQAIFIHLEGKTDIYTSAARACAAVADFNPKPEPSDERDALIAWLEVKGSCTEHDWPQDWAGENGQYWNNCTSCGVQFCGHKCRRTCRKCHGAALQEGVE